MKKSILAIASGLLLFAAFPPFTLWPAAFLGAALLFFLLADEKLNRRFLLALLAGEPSLPHYFIGAQSMLDPCPG